MRISDWSSDFCSSDLRAPARVRRQVRSRHHLRRRAGRHLRGAGGDARGGWRGRAAAGDLSLPGDAPMRSTLFAVPLALAVLLAAPAGRANDYPTEVIADYVLACMAANGNTAEALRQCSCSLVVLPPLLASQDFSKPHTEL